jgi:hypothetical protein
MPYTLEGVGKTICDHPDHWVLAPVGSRRLELRSERVNETHDSGGGPHFRESVGL